MTYTPIDNGETGLVVRGKINGIGTSLDAHIDSSGSSVHGLGTISTQNSDNVNIDGGTIDETVITDTTLETDSKTVSGAINELQEELGFLSAGVFGSEASFTDNGNGTATIGSVDVLLFPNSDFTGAIQKYTVSGSTFTFTDGAEEYVAVKYNSGSPVMYKETVLTNLNYSDVIGVVVCWRVGTTTHSLNLDSTGNGLSNKLQIQSYRTELYKRSYEGGLIISETTSPNPRTVAVSSALVYAGSIPYTVSAFNSSTDKMTFVYHVSGSWNYADQLVYNNQYYDDGTDLVAIPSTGGGRYGIMWFYRSIGDVKQVFYVCGDNYYNSPVDAYAISPRTDLPQILKRHCMLVGRAIIRLNGTSGQMESAFGISFSGQININHNDTTNIQGGTTSEYYHLTSAEHDKISSASYAGRFGDGTNYSTFENDGTLVFSGSATVWDDLFVPLTQTKQGSNLKPEFDYTTVTYQFPQNSTAEALYMVVQMPHSWKEGSTIYPHVHWIQSANQQPVFKMDYKWTSIGSAISGSATYTMNTNHSTYTSGSIHQMTGNATGISGSGKTISSILAIKLYRDDNVYTGVVPTYQFDIHFEKDTVGSRTASEK